jgi:fucose 4-O-acetylase-like acetyltransferase
MGSNSFVIPNRLNWIDWAKAMAIIFVVYGHIPSERDDFLHYYITAFHMPLFFFISGFLTKKEYMCKKTLTKYWHTLIIPYLCYNAIFYPYWAAKFTIEHPTTEWFDFIKPIIGTLMLQLKTPYSDYLNGVTWFISSLLVMKILFSICNKYKIGKYIIILLMIATGLFYIINEFYLFVSTLTPVSFTKCFPFFFLGYYCKQKKFISEKPQKKDMAFCLGGLLIGATTYTIVITKYSIPLYGISFWIMCVSSICGILSLCKLLDGIKSKIIENISIGTIVIMGLHWMFIGTTNFIIGKLCHLNGGITYPPHVIILLTLIFVALEYPIILLFKNKYPFMLGKK